MLRSLRHLRPEASLAVVDGRARSGGLRVGAGPGDRSRCRSQHWQTQHRRVEAGGRPGGSRRLSSSVADSELTIVNLNFLCPTTGSCGVKEDARQAQACSVGAPLRPVVGTGDIVNSSTPPAMSDA